MATIFRFIVPTFAVTSFLVSQALVAPQIEKQRKELEESTKVVETISDALSDPDDPEAEVRALIEQRTRLKEELESLQVEEERLTILINERETSDWWPISDSPDEALAKANALVKETESKIRQKESELACIERRTTGEECDSFLADHRMGVLGDLRLKIESQLTKLTEELASASGRTERMEKAGGRNHRSHQGLCRREGLGLAKCAPGIGAEISRRRS